MKIEIEESALDSLKAMVQQLQDERDMLLKEMRYIARISTGQVKRVADAAIAACTETKQVLA